MSWSWTVAELRFVRVVCMQLVESEVVQIKRDAISVPNIQLRAQCGPEAVGAHWWLDGTQMQTHYWSITVLWNAKRACDAIVRRMQRVHMSGRDIRQTTSCTPFYHCSRVAERELLVSIYTSVLPEKLTNLVAIARRCTVYSTESGLPAGPTFASEIQTNPHISTVQLYIMQFGILLVVIPLVIMLNVSWSTTVTKLIEILNWKPFHGWISKSKTHTIHLLIPKRSRAWDITSTVLYMYIFELSCGLFDYAYCNIFRLVSMQTWL